MRLVELYQEKVLGVLEGLDRIRFRGTDRMLSNASGFSKALSLMNVRLVDFGKWAESSTLRLRQCCAHQAGQMGIKVDYLRSSGIDKEALARLRAKEQGIHEDGSICMFSVVEPCVAPLVHGNRQTQKLEVDMRVRKCVFIYYYFDHPEVGFGHVRLQTWAPYTAHICLNGRHWLEKQLLAEGIGYQKLGNCFGWVEDAPRAQLLLDEQLRSSWPQLLNGLVSRVCPIVFELCHPFTLAYYWSADETEYATDVMFRSRATLDALFPSLLFHGMRVSDSKTTLRYLSKNDAPVVSGRLPKEIHSDCRARHEGLRVKHWVNGNSVKMYNKSGNVLRVETTINNPRQFKAYRPANDDESKPATWQKMRKGVNDLHRRCEVSRNANHRYLDTMGAAQVEQSLHEVAKAACNRTVKNGRSVRGLNPWNERDFRLLTFLAQGQWAINGFRNKNLCQWLEPDYDALDERERKKLSARASRLIGLLRTHGLVYKVTKENRYVLSGKGQTFVNVLLIASNAQVKQLTEMAA